jgi:hypothetical protein
MRCKTAVILVLFITLYEPLFAQPKSNPRPPSTGVRYDQSKPRFHPKTRHESSHRTNKHHGKHKTHKH